MKALFAHENTFSVLIRCRPISARAPSSILGLRAIAAGAALEWRHSADAFERLFCLTAKVNVFRSKALARALRSLN